MPARRDPCTGPNAAFGAPPRLAGSRPRKAPASLFAATLLLAGLVAVPALHAAPAIGTVTPASGSSNGGTALDIAGSGFVEGTVVQFLAGGTAVTLEGIRLHAGRLAATTPPHAPGRVDVRVINPDGSSARSGLSFTYLEAAAPTIDEVSASEGPANGGTQMEVRGSGFSSAVLPEVVLRATRPDAVAGQRVRWSVREASADRIVAVTSGAALPVAGVLQRVEEGTVEVVNPDGASAAASGSPFTYFPSPAPVVGDVSPASGPSTGGTAVAVTGRGFWPGAQVVFATGPIRTPAASVGFVDATRLVAVTPPQAAGGTPTDVEVVNPDGQAALVRDAYRFTPAEAGPQATAVRPQRGPSGGGTPVTLFGSGFAPGLRVRFGGSDATEARFVSPTQATAVTPACPSGSSSCGEVAVANPDGTASAAAPLFTYAPQVAITGVSPRTVDTSGATKPGNRITVTGTGFSPSGCQLLVGGMPAAATECSATSATAFAPAGTAGGKDVQVVNPDGRTATLQAGLGYTLAAAPTLTGATPSEVGSNGALVTLAGTGFSPVAGTGAAAGAYLFPTVAFTTAEGTARATVLGAAPDGTALTVLAPPVDAQAIGGAQSDCGLASGNLPCLAAAITVTNADGQSAVLPAFRPSPFGSLAGVGGKGTPNFDYVADEPAALEGCALSASDAEACEASVTDGGAILHLAGAFVPGVPTAAGRVGATAFRVGDAPAAIDERGGRGLTASEAWIVVPPTRAAGTAGVTATNPDGSADTVDRYLAYTKPPAPEFFLDRASGSSNGAGEGEGNGLVTLGAATAAFGAGATVRFGNASVTMHVLPCGAVDAALAPVRENCVADAGPNPNPSGRTGAATPQHGTAGSRLLVRPPGHAPGAVAVTVANRDGRSFTRPNAYQYLEEPAPTVGAVEPASAPGRGGARLTITGTGFATGSLESPALGYLKPAVTVGGTPVPAANVTVHDATRLTVVLPPHAPGPATVVVANPGGLGASLAGAFRFTGVPRGVALSPNHASQDGGARVALSGEGFDPAGAPLVSFGTAAAVAASTVLSPSSAAVAVPAAARGAAPGPVPVFLADPDGQTLTLAGGFTYTPAVPPAFASLAPAAGSTNGGTLVTVRGQGFAPGVRVCLGRPALDASDLPCSAASRHALPGVQWLDSTTLQFATPSSPPGPAGLALTNPSGGMDQTLALPAARSLFSFAQVPSPILSAVDPPSGNATGGTPVTLTGAAFVDGTRVLFGALPAANVTVQGPGLLTAVTPPHLAGPVGVTVEWPEGGAYTLLPAFTYLGPGGTAEPPTANATAGNATAAQAGDAGNATAAAGLDPDPADAGPTGGLGTEEDVSPGEPALAAAQILAANQGVLLDVQRDGGDTIVRFALPSGLPAEPAGVQLFRGGGRFALLATLPRDDPAFLARAYRDVGAPPDARYLVTVYYAGGQGKAAAGPDEVPGFAELGIGTRAAAVGEVGVSAFSYAVAGAALAPVVLGLAALGLRRPRAPG